MPKTIYLTIDDFPSTTSHLLMEFLCEKQIPATFFCIGKKLKNNMAAGAKALEMGFSLGNHSYSHPKFSSISLFRIKREISRTHKLIDQLYRDAGVMDYTPMFRFPYGDKGDGRVGRVLDVYLSRRGELKGKKIQSYLGEIGYKPYIPEDVTYDYYRNNLGMDNDIHWTLDSMDWALKNSLDEGQEWNMHRVKERFFSMNPLELRGLIDEKFYGMPYSGSGEIVLAHDHPQTLTAVKHLVSELLDLGMQFKGLSNGAACT